MNEILRQCYLSSRVLEFLMRIVILVHLGCCNRNITDGVEYKQHLLLIFLEAGKSKIKALADSVSGENPPPGSDELYYVLKWQEGKGALWFLF